MYGRHAGTSRRLDHRDVGVGALISLAVLGTFVLGLTTALVVLGAVVLSASAALWLRGLRRGGLDRAGRPVLHAALLGSAVGALGLGLTSLPEQATLPAASAEAPRPAAEVLGVAPPGAATGPSRTGSTTTTVQPTSAAEVDATLAPGARAASALPRTDRTEYVLQLPAAERPPAGSGVSVGIPRPATAAATTAPGGAGAPGAATAPPTGTASAPSPGSPAVPTTSPVVTTGPPVVPTTTPGTAPVTTTPTTGSTTTAPPVETAPTTTAPATGDGTAATTSATWLDEMREESGRAAPPAAPSTGVEEIVASLGDG